MSGEKRPESLLIVDDDEQIRKQLEWALSDEYEIRPARDRAEALEIFRSHPIDLVLLDLGLPPRPREAEEGLLALEEILEIRPRTRVVIVSGNSDRQNAVRAVELGAHDIFPKPIDIDQLRVVLERVRHRLVLERSGSTGADAGESTEFEDMIGSSQAMHLVFDTVRKVCSTDVPVLITGESGTGKERVANALHRLSPRSRAGRFVPINCGAIPENLVESELFGHERGAFTGADSRRKGKVEYADRGTLFLDELGEISPAAQVKLLRFLQEGIIERVGGREPIRIDARIVAATNIDLEEAVRAGSFREDLYYRLAVVRLELPPLRDRGEDVLRIADHFVREFCKEYDKPPKALSQSARRALEGHRWAGNVRELQNRVRRAVVLADGPTIGARELDLEPTRSGAPAIATTNLKDAKDELERRLVEQALSDHKGNVSRTSKALGVSRPTLYELMSKHGLRDSRADDETRDPARRRDRRRPGGERPRAP